MSGFRDRIMKIFGITFIALLLLITAIPAFGGTVKTDIESVRRMFIAPEKQDFSVFDQTLLPGILIQIIEKDPGSSDTHDLVAISAIKALAAMKIPEAVPVLIKQADNYTTTCIYWLATYADPSAVNTIASYLDDKDPSVRYEAASALGRIPAPSDKTGKEYLQSLEDALGAAAARVSEEDDNSVLDALWNAVTYLMNISLEPGM
jgi:hypothetical protein